MIKFRLPILNYHNISDKINYYTAVSFSTFCRQLETLKREFKYIDLNSAVEAYEQNKTLSMGFSVTFDDGYEDIVPALDYLESMGDKATLFVPTDSVGKDNRWNHKATFISNILNSSQLKKISLQGHIIGSHGIFHQCLTKLNDDELTQEITKSKSILEEIINKKVDFFAYPFGYHDERVRKITSNYYKAGFATNKTAESIYWDDLFQIYRLSVNNDTTTESIIDYVKSCYAT